MELQPGSQPPPPTADPASPDPTVSPPTDPRPVKLDRGARLEARLEGSRRWLSLAQDAILVAVAVLMLVLGVMVLLDGVGELFKFGIRADGGLTLQIEAGRAVVEIAENALLALILAELVGTLLLSLGGKALSLPPFLIIAIVAIVRHLLFLSVQGGNDPIQHTIELLGQGVLIVLLVGALVLARWGQRQDHPADRH